MTDKTFPGYKTEFMPPVEKPDLAMQVRRVDCIRPYGHDGRCVFRDGETHNTLASKTEIIEADMDEALALGAKASKRWARTLELLKQAEAEEREQAR